MSERPIDDIDSCDETLGALQNEDLAERYMMMHYGGDVAPGEKEAAGREVMRRTLTKSDRQHYTGQLMPIERISDQGKPMAIDDYLKVAGRHGNAIDTIAMFVAMDEQDEQYSVFKQQMQGMLDFYMQGVRG